MGQQTVFLILFGYRIVDLEVGSKKHEPQRKITKNNHQLEAISLCYRRRVRDRSRGFATIRSGGA